MKTARLAPFAYTLLFMGLLSGCWEKGPNTTSVQGHVFFRDRMLTHGTIVFTSDPERGGKGDMACGEIQPDGGYALKSKALTGIEPGWYRVTILALEPSRSGGDANSFNEPRSLLPDKYRDPNMSGLSVEVLPDQMNVKDFHVEE